MKIHFAVAVILAAGLGSAPAHAQSSAADAHVAKAKAAAGLDFSGALDRLCILPPTMATVRAAGPRVAGPRKVPDRATWYAEPVRMFDNLYWVGTKIHSSWALKTSGGIILIDTLYNYAAEPEIVDGLKKLGLDPATVKYVIVSHGHGDHDEGARLMQDRYHAHIVMGGPDWNAIEKTDMPGGTPRRDMVATDGEKITLGDGSVTIVTTPGHTPGTLSMIFQVKDRGKPLTVAYSGGTATNGGFDAAVFRTYIASQKKIARAAAAAGATVLMSNHSEFDNAYMKGRMLASRRPGEAHPLEIGAAAVARYFTVTAECAEAGLANLKP